VLRQTHGTLPSWNVRQPTIDGAELAGGEPLGEINCLRW
jgi:hypothetical protein